MKCPHCNKEIPQSEISRHLGKLGGRVKNEKRAAASRANGKLGGRPKRSKNKPKTKRKQQNEN